MRQYLYGATDTSTLPGFPGDFADDWKLFLEQYYGLDSDDINNAEHEVMATKYHNIIVDGLKEFGDPSFSLSDYEAVAWIGLQGTKYYNQILNGGNTQTTQTQINSAKNKANSSCN